MEKRAFFLQGDALLLPADIPDSQTDSELPLYLADNFNNPEIFEIAAIDGNDMINVVSILPKTAIPENWKIIPVRQLLFNSAADGAGIHAASNIGKIIRACHISQWRNDSRFCGTCGAKNGFISPETHCLCPDCGRMEFPRICPAVIVLIADNKNRILLAHNKMFKSKIYSHISGFNEAGETLEETVAREIREEVNIEVCDITYIKSQPWPFPNSLMLGFKARYLSGTIKPDGNEIEDAGWFEKDSLPQLPGQGSLARSLIDYWLETPHGNRGAQ